MESGVCAFLEFPIVHEFSAFMCIEESMYRVLVLDREVHSGEQVVIVIMPGSSSRLEQSELHPHYADPSPVYMDTGLYERK